MTVKRYIRKQILTPPVKAIQWTGNNMLDISDFVRSSLNYEATFTIKNNKWELCIRDCSYSSTEYKRSNYVVKEGDHFFPVSKESFNDGYELDE